LLDIYCTGKKYHNYGASSVQFAPPPTSRVMTSSIEVGSERRSHTKFCDDVSTTSRDTACQSWRSIRIQGHSFRL